MTTNLKLLLLEDDADDVFLIESFLRDHEFILDTTVVANEREYTDALTTNAFDIILSDHRMHNFSSLRALRIKNAMEIGIPFILVTGTVSEEFAVGVVKEGASDYILKSKLQRLPSAIENALEKRRTELEMKKQRERFELASEASYDVICDYDFASDTLYCSKGFSKYGYQYGEGLPGDTLQRHLHPADRPRTKRDFEKFCRSGEVKWKYFFRLLSVDGTAFYIDCSASLSRDENGKPKKAILVLHDITPIKEMQSQIYENEINRQKLIALTTIEAQEKERKEIAKELHDNVQQLMATAKLMIETAINHEELAHDSLCRAKEILLHAITETRTLTHSVMPPSFENKSFLRSIEEITKDISLSTSIKLTCQFPPVGKLDVLSENAKLAIYRIIQEQLNNILKYSHASVVLISLLIDQHLRLIIKDNGVGFNPEEEHKGIGLLNISNRAEMLNGSMKIISAPDKGTELLIDIPLAQVA